MKGSVHVAPRNNARDLEVRLNEDGSVGLKATFSSGQISRATLSGIQELTEILYGKKKVTTFEGCGLFKLIDEEILGLLVNLRSLNFILSILNINLIWL